MKRLRVFSIALVVVFMTFGVASAASYWFSDTIDKWGDDGALEWAHIPNYPNTHDYQHDINDEVDFANGDLVTKAYLALDFDWDFTDSIGVAHIGQCNYTIAWDNTEFSWIQFDDSGWKFVDEVDNDEEFLTVGIDWLNDDGLLDVSLTVVNWLWNANAWLDSSTLFGVAETGSPSPVPEPSTMILLGMGVVGIFGTGREKIFKKK
jgi:hypothetical protein